MKNDNISRTVEAICSQGCTSVSGIIDMLEKGETVNQASHLSCEELMALLKELKSIMAVYDSRG